MLSLQPRSLGAGTAVPSFLRLSLSDGVVTDANARLAAPITYDGTSFTVQLTGGWSSTDPGDWPYIIFPLVDFNGKALTAATKWDFTGQIVERTPPGLSSDTSVMIGVLNEGANIGTSGTVDGYLMGMRYASATRNVRVVRLLNGVSTVSEDAPGGTGLMRICVGTITRPAAGGTNFVYPVTAVGVSAAAGPISGDATIESSGAVTLGSGALYIIIAIGRTAATAGTETIVFSAYNLTPPGVVTPT